MALRLNRSSGIAYNAEYKVKLFQEWYNLGKPGSGKFRNILIQEKNYDPMLGDIPTGNLITKWIREEWSEYAIELDEQAMNTLEQEIIADKVEMLKRHADIGKKMQEMSMEYLNEHGVGSSRNAIQLLVSGMEIERISVGTPKIASKYVNMSDQQLLDELKRVVTGGKLLMELEAPSDPNVIDMVK